MDPVSNTNRLVRLLRQRLQDRSGVKSPTQAPSAPSVKEGGIEAVKAVTGQFARLGGKDEKLKRTLVEQLLADQFGNTMVNEPKFQEIVDRVTLVIEADPSLSVMLGDVVLELKSLPE
jgi:hypothetical protein